jgi:hypothetical protein
MGAEITDGAAELAAAIRKLAEQPSSTDATWIVIKRLLGRTVGTTEFWEIIAALRSRVEAFLHFVSVVKDDEFSEAQRDSVLSAARRFSGVFEPEQMNGQWQITLSACVSKQDALMLEWFSIIAKRYRPLRRVSDDDRKQLIEQIDEVLKRLNDASDVADWAKEPLATGLRRLQLVLRHLLFFGSEAAIFQLFDLFQKTAGVANELDRQADPESRPTILQTLTIIALAANIFWLPDQATTAFERYVGWYISLMKSNALLPKPEQKLLPKPPANDGDERPEMPRAARDAQ